MAMKTTKVKDYHILTSGFGGQGILFLGKIIAYAGLQDGKEVSWLPSYGPEMRGGTANCSVCISTESIASPLVITPNILIAMNAPSYDKFIDSVEPGGFVFADSSLIQNRANRDDVETYYLPATNLADKNALSSHANMVMLGALIEKTKFAAYDLVEKSIRKSVTDKNKHLIEPNLKAVKLGMDYFG